MSKPDGFEQTLLGTPDTLRENPSVGEAATMAAPSAPLSPALSEAPTALVTKDGNGEKTPSGSRELPREIDGRRYAISTRIGAGGMGEVLLAFDEQIGREVAVKRMRAEVESADSLARFVREARVQGRLEHPAVVPVHDLAVDGQGRPFFVMKKLSGTTMSELLSAAQQVADPLPLRRRLWRAFVDICLAIEFAHRKGVVHRDLKPANIMLGDFGEVYVLDWGVARTSTVVAAPPLRPSAVTLPNPTEIAARTALDSSDLALQSGETRAGTILGTPGYMAPEQLDGEAVGPAADIYALGSILYEISAGKPMHPRGHAALVSTSEATFNPHPSAIVETSPPELDRIIAKAVAKDPSQRFASARELGDQVQAFLDGDRDLALRKTLASQHVEVARSALAQGSDQDSRRKAMQAAGRALALDPTSTAAGELITHLMLEPPIEVPREVEQRMEEIDTETARAQGKLAAQSLFGYLGFLPLMLWTGVRSWPVIIAFLTLAVASAGQIWILTQRTAISTRGIYVNVVINAVLIGLVSRICGPFFVAPTLVATTLVAYAAHPRFGRMSIVAAILSASIFVPWLLELVGVLEPTYRFISGSIVLTSPAIRFESVPIQIAFAISLVALLGVVAILGRVMALRQRQAARQLEISAWHVRQLVPAPASTSQTNLSAQSTRS